MSASDDDTARIRFILGAYLNDPWIERRSKLKEVMDCLEASQDGIGRHWIQFVRFLEEHCTGLQVNLRDKQWGELLNLMMISRKVNHKSVRFKDILANKQQIESNAQQIRDFSVAARLGQATELGLNDLEQLIQSGVCISLPTIQSSGNELKLERLSETSSFMRDKCRPLLSSLELSLEDEKIARDPRLDGWRTRQTKLALALRKMSDFIAAMIELQSKLLKIKYLDTVMEAEDNKSALKSKVRSSIELCRREMGEIQEFHQRSVNLLCQVANRTTSSRATKSDGAVIVLPLIKVFEPKEHISADDIRAMALDKLDECQRKLDQIMQGLRGEFGRFYFLNDSELLNIVMIDLRLALRSEAEENKRIICKLFNNSISCFLLDEQQKHLIGVQSPVQETIRFGEQDYVPLRKAVQVYSLEIVRILNDVQRKLRRTLKSILLRSIRHSAHDHIDWSLPVQLVNLAECVKFCSRVEKILQSSSSSSMSAKSFDALIELYEQQSRLLSQQLTGSQPTTSGKISTSISMNVHFISLLMRMKHEKVAQITDWLWQKQVRYYVCPDDAEDSSSSGEQLEVRIADAKFRYKFDYLCNDQQQPHQERGCKRLISTKLTERCFLLASQAVCHLRLGANPFGPAGGGKTETIKALGQLLGQQVIVHNCDEMNDIESLDRLVWGLAHTGLWGCFDEFNRLSSSTMSVISAALELIQSAIRENKTTVQQMGGCTSHQSTELMMSIDRDSAFFITLNPASSSTYNKYKGRRQLPANLRNLFLPISMVRVQIDSIVRENLLVLSIEHHQTVSVGETNIIEFSLSMQEFLEKVRQLNLGADRCEWDLRLVMASLQRLRILKQQQRGGETALLTELMVEALCCEVEPRLSNDEFSNYCTLSRESFGFDSHSSGPRKATAESTKVAHLSRQLETRMGVLLVGPMKSGKSNTWRSLVCGNNNWIAVNPKFCSQLELFGGFFGLEDTSNRKRWRDGYFTSKVREALALLQANANLNQVYLVLDGPIDPDWIESLNSVLDDNRVLTLGSGERLNFCLPGNNQSIKLIFETDNIRLASPATISRLGLVYFEPQEAQAHQLNEVNVERMEQVDSYLQTDIDWRLIIICGQHLDHKAIDCFFKQSGSVVVSSYCCNQHSDSGHLVDLLNNRWWSSPEKRLQLIMTIHNVDLIEAQDQWASRSFLELLRFSVDYRGYYDQQFAFKSIEQLKFVLTCQNLHQIDHRLVGKSSLIVHLKSSCINLRHDELKVDHLKEAILPEDGGLLIFKNNLHLSRQEINQLISLQHELKLCLFDNHTRAQESLDCVNQLQKVLYILHDIELQLMDTKMRAKLLHLLNRLDPRRAIVVFVCSSHEIPAHMKSMANKVFLLSYNDRIMHQNVQDSLGVTFKQETKIVAWLEDRIFSSARDKEKMDSLVGAFLKLYHKSSSSLLLQQRALKSGLNHLQHLDEKVEQMRMECAQQGSMLREKDAQIRETSRSIDLSLRDSEHQRAQVSELGQQLESRRSDMLKKSQQLELELAQVSPMLEASQADVRQYLKPEALNEIRTLRAPPKTIKDILDALFIMLGVRDLAWSSMKSYLASKSLRDELTNYKFEERINAAMLSSVQELIGQRGESFQPDQARRASRAVVPLLSWIRSSLEYGKVLIRWEPLRLELQQLNEQLDKSNESLREAQANLEEISESIRLQEKRLSDLRKENEQLKQESTQLEQQSQKSQKLRSDLEGQTIRWGQDLHRINSLVAADDNNPNEFRLIKMCLMATSMALMNDCHADNRSRPKDGGLKLWLDKFDLDQDQELGQLSLVLGLDQAMEQLTSSSDDEARIVELIALRQLLESVDPPWLPYIPLGDSGEEICAQEEIIESLCYRKLLAFSRKDILYVIFQWDLSHLRQVAGHHNKLICLDVRRIQEESHLDLAHFLLNRPPGCKFILIGAGAGGGGCGRFEQTLTRYLVRFASIVTIGSTSQDQVQAHILNSLLEVREPILMKDIEEKQMQLNEKQNDLRINEITLLNQLVVAKQSKSESENYAHVVRVLSELQQLNLELGADRKLLDGLRCSLESRKLDSHLASSRENARFYIDMLAPMRGLCRFSVKKYTQLLLPEQQPGSKQTNNMKLEIIRHATLAMDPRQRREFVEKVREAKFDDDDAACTNEVNEAGGSGVNDDDDDDDDNEIAQGAKTQLGITILRDVLADSGATGVTRATNRCQLIVVLHDPSKSSSPQQEIDYLFAAGAAARALFETYDKVYATGDKFGQARLEAALRKFAANDNGNGNRGITMTKTVSRCLCVVNAHLSTTWLNANLLDCLEMFSPSGNDVAGANDATTSLARNHEGRRLLILIGETASPASAELFDERILDYAYLRYWHDELALSLIDRFDTYAAAAAGEPENLRTQLILLHVVCQERAKIRHSQQQAASDGWLGSYNFDQDQLNLGLKMLERLAGERSPLEAEDSLRARLSDYLADIVYGSRMETSKDELQLEKLVGRFLRSPTSGREQLRLLEELRTSTVSDHDRLLEKLIGLEPFAGSRQ